MGFAKDVVKYMFSKKCPNMFVCSFKNKHHISNSIEKQILDTDKLETNCTKCDTPLLLLANKDMYYITEDFDLSIDDCVEECENRITTKECLTDIYKVMFSKAI